ncbi:MAG TPA: flagella basal body P-ring formation protein FlgA, partial [Candidatus Angelobacter sp.]|nr:flagella basal body P-ring formation protein FlgA [Candidatus Angelobacter sp.]
TSPTRTPKLEPWLVRNGDVATLVMQSEHLQVRIPVICLANGSVGKRIRVSSTDHRRIYTAEVVSGKLLRGEL